MKKLNITLVFVLLVKFLNAQNEAMNWYFGDSAGITFSTNPPTFLPGGQINTSEGCASISDNTGNLLFYSDGVKIWCSNHSVMPNGTGLYGNSSSTQSCLIFKAPGSLTLYYVITAPEQASTFPLAYSVVDMTLNGGLGAVVSKNDTLLLSSTEKVTAVNHSNGNDIWIIGHVYPNNNFYAFLVTSSGINVIPVISSAGTSYVTNYNKVGCMKASPCGNNLSTATLLGGAINNILELFDFNNSSGAVTNALQLGSWSAGALVSSEFSPDESRLYASFTNPGLIFQYNLLAGSPPAIIASLDTIAIPPIIKGNLQTGPDGRIYVAKYNSNYLACITNPNQLGALCGYVENFVSLGTATSYFCLPNYLTSLFCNISVGVNNVNEEESISFYPNPFKGAITIKSNSDFFNKHGEFAIYDLLGFKIKQAPIISQNTTLNMSNLPSGVYLLSIIINGERTMKKIVKD